MTAEKESVLKLVELVSREDAIAMLEAEARGKGIPRTNFSEEEVVAKKKSGEASIKKDGIEVSKLALILQNHFKGLNIPRSGFSLEEMEAAAKENGFKLVK